MGFREKLVAACESAELQKSKEISGDPIPVDELNDDLLLHIFSFLSDAKDVGRARRVCRRWLALSSESSMRTQLDMAGLGPESQHVFTSCVEDGHRLQSLSIRKCVFGPEVAALVRDKCGLSLTSLSVEDCENFEEVLEGALIPEYFPALTHLTLRYLNTSEEMLSDLVLSLGDRLEHLDVGGCQNVNNNFLKSISTQCPCLVSLSLDNCVGVSNPGMETLLEGLGHQLESLILSFCWRITNKTVQSIGDRCPVLRRLSLHGCQNTEDLGVVSLTGGCKALTSIDLSGCTSVTDGALVAVGRRLRKLTELRVSGCRRVTSEGLKFLVAGCDYLKEINIGEIDGVDDTVLAAIGGHGSSIATLRMSGCWNITDEGIQAMTEGGRLDCLSHLDVTCCSDLSDSAVAMIARACPNLSSLNLTACGLVTDKGLISLSKNTPKLTFVGLRGCSNISDVGVRALAFGCNFLKRVDLNDCSAVTDTAIRSLRSYCVGLKEVSVDGCIKVTDDTKRLFKLSSF